MPHKIKYLYSNIACMCVFQNAFIHRLGEDFNLHRMLTVDFMHEYNLGVWKSVFMQLVRLLYSQKDGVDKVAELDRR